MSQNYNNDKSGRRKYKPENEIIEASLRTRREKPEE
jgi:hypothetical protein